MALNGYTTNYVILQTKSHLHTAHDAPRQEHGHSEANTYTVLEQYLGVE
jgi:hypothetical protein